MVVVGQRKRLCLASQDYDIEQGPKVVEAPGSQHEDRSDGMLDSRKIKKKDRQSLPLPNG